MTSWWWLFLVPVLASAGYWAAIFYHSWTTAPPEEIVADEPVELWRSHRHASDCILISTDVLWRLAGDAELETMARTEAERTQLIADDMAVNGLKEPLTLCIDAVGDIGVLDGHHRIWIAQQFGIERLPVTFTPVPRFTLKKIPVLDFLLEVAHSSSI